RAAAPGRGRATAAHRRGSHLAGRRPRGARTAHDLRLRHLGARAALPGQDEDGGRGYRCSRGREEPHGPAARAESPAAGHARGSLVAAHATDSMRTTARDAYCRAGFTLIEVLAVLFLTALLVGTAIGFYIDLSNHSQKATDTTREVRRATTLIDRIASDV